MQKLTQREAQELVSRAWSLVGNQNLGSYRFGQSLHNSIPFNLLKEFGLVDNDGYPYLDSEKPYQFYYESDSDIVLVKFYQWFVEDSNN